MKKLLFVLIFGLVITFLVTRVLGWYIDYTDQPPEINKAYLSELQPHFKRLSDVQVEYPYVGSEKLVKILTSRGNLLGFLEITPENFSKSNSLHLDSVNDYLVICQTSKEGTYKFGFDLFPSQGDANISPNITNLTTLIENEEIFIDWLNENIPETTEFSKPCIRVCWPEFDGQVDYNICRA